MDLPEVNDTLDDRQNIEVEQQANSEKRSTLERLLPTGTLPYAIKGMAGSSRPK